MPSIWDLGVSVGLSVWFMVGLRRTHPQNAHCIGTHGQHHHQQHRPPRCSWGHFGAADTESRDAGEGGQETERAGKGGNGLPREAEEGERERAGGGCGRDGEGVGWSGRGRAGWSERRRKGAEEGRSRARKRGRRGAGEEKGSGSTVHDGRDTEGGGGRGKARGAYVRLSAGATEHATPGLTHGGSDTASWGRACRSHGPARGPARRHRAVRRDAATFPFAVMGGHS